MKIGTGDVFKEPYFGNTYTILGRDLVPDDRGAFIGVVIVRTEPETYLVWPEDSILEFEKSGEWMRVSE